MNIVFEASGTTTSVSEMIESTQRGILVTRLWYIREVDAYEKILTGMTRDGTFLIEDGHVTQGLRNFRFNESLLHMLSHVEALGYPVLSYLVPRPASCIDVGKLEVRDTKVTLTTTIVGENL